MQSVMIKATSREIKMTKRSEKNVKMAASRSANALDRAAKFLEAARNELDEAQAAASVVGEALDAGDEILLLNALNIFLAAPSGPSLAGIRELRDRRAARAGFRFEE
jgi:hypothetical protein